MTNLDKMMIAFKEEREVKDEALRLAGVLATKAGQFLNCGSHSRNYAKYWEELKEALNDYNTFISENTLKDKE